MSEQYIFTIERLGKAYGKREVLKNIWLAFYPGAKIGVIGSNGAGKSTLLRVMAIQETDFIGAARLTPGFTVGYVPQEPRLTPDKTVLDNIEEAVVQTRALIKKQEDYTFFKSIFWWSGVVSPHTPKNGVSAFEKAIFGSDVFGGDLAEFDGSLERYRKMLDVCGVSRQSQANIFSGTLWKILQGK